MIAIDKSPTLSTYREKMVQILSMIYPLTAVSLLYDAVNYSIEKHFKDSEAEYKFYDLKKERKD